VRKGRKQTEMEERDEKSEGREGEKRGEEAPSSHFCLRH